MMLVLYFCTLQISSTCAETLGHLRVCAFFFVFLLVFRIVLSFL